MTAILIPFERYTWITFDSHTNCNNENLATPTEQYFLEDCETLSSDD